MESIESTVDPLSGTTRPLSGIVYQPDHRTVVFCNRETPILLEHCEACAVDSPRPQYSLSQVRSLSYRILVVAMVCKISTHKEFAIIHSQGRMVNRTATWRLPSPR